MTCFLLGSFIQFACCLRASQNALPFLCTCIIIFLFSLCVVSVDFQMTSKLQIIVKTISKTHFIMLKTETFHLLVFHWVSSSLFRIIYKSNRNTLMFAFNLKLQDFTAQQTTTTTTFIWKYKYIFYFLFYDDTFYVFHNESSILCSEIWMRKKIDRKNEKNNGKVQKSVLWNAKVFPSNGLKAVRILDMFDQNHLNCEQKVKERKKKLLKFSLKFLSEKWNRMCDKQ